MKNLKKQFSLVLVGMGIMLINSCNSQGPKTGGPCDYERFIDRFLVVGVDTTESYYLFEFRQVNNPDFVLTLNHLELKEFLDIKNVNELSETMGDTVIITGEQITKGTCTPLIVSSVEPAESEE